MGSSARSRSSSCTSFHMTGAEMLSYSWRSTFPIPATFAHGISGCRSLSSSVKRRLASEIVSTPRSTSHRLRQSASKASIVTPALFPHGCARLHREYPLAAAQERKQPSEHLQCRCFDPRPQNLVETVPRHDVDLAAEDTRGLLLNIHQLEEAELPLFVIEE